MKNMKKLSLLFILVFVASVGVQAQGMFQFGIKGAFNYSKLKSEDNRWLSSANKTGYQVGIWTRIGGVIHVQPELYLTGKSSEANFVVNANDVKADVNFTSLDLPILLGSRVGLGPVGLRFQAGPLISFVVDKKVGDALQNVIDVDEYKNNTVALVGGVGLDVGKFRADVRYEHAMNSLTRESSPEQKINVWTVGVGIRLF